MNRTKIEWCDWTWNPVVGCSAVSVGCAHCYAATVAHQKKHHPNAKIRAAYEGLTDGAGQWTGAVRFLPERLDEPARVKKPGLVFVSSMGDLGHACVKRLWRELVYAAMRAAPWHTYVVLTKRPGPWLRDVPPDVWLGVTAENQEMLVRRVDALMESPAHVKVVSFEPLLERVKVNPTND